MRVKVPIVLAVLVILSGIGIVIHNVDQHRKQTLHAPLTAISKQLNISHTHKKSLAHGVSKDPMWIEDPVNYEVAKKSVTDLHVFVPILEYHEAKYLPGDTITLRPGQFLQEVEWLHSNGFHTINFGQLYAAMYHGYKLPPRPVLITFDDGYESAYLQVYPILKKYGYQATCFVISGYVHEKPDRKARFPKLTISELKQLQASGVIDIESHTVHHTKLGAVSDAVANAELSNSAKALSKIVGHKIEFFCYPFGSYNHHTISLLKNNGYLLATTEHRGYANLSQGPFTLKRIEIMSTDNLTSFKSYLAPSLNKVN